MYMRIRLPRNTLRFLTRYTTVFLTSFALVFTGPLMALRARAAVPDAPQPLTAASFDVRRQSSAVYLPLEVGDDWASDSHGFTVRGNVTQPSPVLVDDLPMVPYRLHAFSDTVAVELAADAQTQLIVSDRDSLTTTIFASTDESRFVQIASQELVFERLAVVASLAEDTAGEWEPVIPASVSVLVDTLSDRARVSRTFTFDDDGVSGSGVVDGEFGFDGVAPINKWTYRINASPGAPVYRLRAVTDFMGEVSESRQGDRFTYSITAAQQAPFVELLSITPEPSIAPEPSATLEPSVDPEPSATPLETETPAPSVTSTPTESMPVETITASPEPSVTQPSGTEIPVVDETLPVVPPVDTSLLQHLWHLLVPSANADEIEIPLELSETDTASTSEPTPESIPEPTSLDTVDPQLSDLPSPTETPIIVDTPMPSVSMAPSEVPLPTEVPTSSGPVNAFIDWLAGLLSGSDEAVYQLVFDISDHNGPAEISADGNRMTVLFSTADATPTDAAFFVDPSFGVLTADTGVTVTSGDGSGSTDFRVHFNPALGGAIDELSTGADFTTNKVSQPTLHSGSLVRTSIGTAAQSEQHATLTVLEASSVRVIVESEAAYSETESLLERYAIYPSGRVVHTSQLTLASPTIVTTSFNASAATMDAAYADIDEAGAVYLSDGGPDLLMYWHDPSALASASVSSDVAEDSYFTQYAIPVPEGQTTWYHLIELTQPDLSTLLPDSYRRHFADYRSPDEPVMTRGSFQGFAPSRAAYQFEAVNNVVVFRLNGDEIPRINPTFEVRAWTDPDMTAFKAQLNGANLVEGVDYVVGFLNGDAYSGTLLFQYLHTVDASDRFGVEGGPALFDIDPSDAAAVKRVQSGTVAYADTVISAAVTLANPVVTSRSFVMTGDHWGGGTSQMSDPEKSRWGSYLADPTTILLDRTAVDTAGGIASLSWQVVEFEDNSGAFIQRGSTSWAADTITEDITLPTSVDTNKAFAMITVHGGSTTQTVDEQWTVRASLSATTLNLSRNEDGTEHALRISWQVIQLDGINVQRGLTTVSGVLGTNVTIGSVNPAKSFVISSARAVAAVNGIDSQYQYNQQLTSATNLRFSKSTATNGIEVAWFVVTFSGTSGTRVQRGTVLPATWTATLNYQPTNVTIPTAVVATRSMALTTAAGAAGGNEGDLDATTFSVRQINTAGTQLRMARFHTGNARTASTSWEVVEFTRPGIQQNRYRWRNDNGTEVTATAIAAENASASLPVGTVARLRFGLYNSDTGSSTNQYRLEFSRKAEGGTCSTGLSPGWTWQQVPVSATTASHAFEIEDSLNLTDASPTTNAAGVLTDDDTVFVAGEVKDSGSQTSSIGLASTSFTEIEYSLIPTGNALLGGKYCFRLTDAGEDRASHSFIFYPRYGEAVVAAGTYTFTQNNVRWYTNLDDLTPLDPWTPGSTPVKASSSFPAAGTTAFVVPTGVTSLTVWVWGAGGGGGEGAGVATALGGNGGAGGFARGTFTVTPGESLDVLVGTGGVANTGTQGAGNGGGFSSIRRGTDDLVQAGGGGGGGSADSGADEDGGNGGAGGGTTGVDGTDGGPGLNDSDGGKAGTQTTGGAGGSQATGENGTAGVADAGGNGGQAGTGGAGGTGGGGDGFADANGAGGGGGGGRFGGGGGENGPTGGGTSEGGGGGGGGSGGFDSLVGGRYALSDRRPPRQDPGPRPRIRPARSDRRRASSSGSNPVCGRFCSTRSIRMSFMSSRKSRRKGLRGMPW